MDTNHLVVGFHQKQRNTTNSARRPMSFKNENLKLKGLFKQVNVSYGNIHIRDVAYNIGILTYKTKYSIHIYIYKGIHCEYVLNRIY